MDNWGKLSAAKPAGKPNLLATLSLLQKPPPPPPKKETVAEKMPKIWVNEVDITGVNDYQKKGTLSQADLQDEENDVSNILYAKSYIVDGFGKAVVCAVGERTQYGMPHIEIEDETMQDEVTPIR